MCACLILCVYLVAHTSGGTIALLWAQPIRIPCISSRAQHPTVTPTGLRFLLLDTYQQLWALLRQYMGAALQGPEGSLSGAVSFLLQLGFRATGRPWALDNIPSEYHTIAGAGYGSTTPYLVLGCACACQQHSPVHAHRSHYTHTLVVMC